MSASSANFAIVLALAALGCSNPTQAGTAADATGVAQDTQADSVSAVDSAPNTDASKSDVPAATELCPYPGETTIFPDHVCAACQRLPDADFCHASLIQATWCPRLSHRFSESWGFAVGGHAYGCFPGGAFDCSYGVFAPSAFDVAENGTALLGVGCGVGGDSAGQLMLVSWAGQDAHGKELPFGESIGSDGVAFPTAVAASGAALYVAAWEPLVGNLLFAQVPGADTPSQLALPLGGPDQPIYPDLPAIQRPDGTFLLAYTNGSAVGIARWQPTTTHLDLVAKADGLLDAGDGQFWPSFVAQDDGVLWAGAFQIANIYQRHRYFLLLQFDPQTASLVATEPGDAESVVVSPVGSKADLVAAPSGGGSLLFFVTDTQHYDPANPSTKQYVCARHLASAASWCKPCNSILGGSLGGGETATMGEAFGQARGWRISLYVSSAAEPYDANAKSFIARVNEFGDLVSNPLSSCDKLSLGSCADKNPCTSDFCDAAHNGCYHVPLPDGITCSDAGGYCSAGQCK